MSIARRFALAASLLLVLASPVAAQQVWITAFENMGAGEKPNGYRFDYNSLALNGVIEVSMAYTRLFPTAGIDVFINGFPQQFSCQVNDTGGGGTATCQAFLPYACGKMRVLVRRAEAPPGGVFQSNAVDIFSYDNQRCVPQCDSCQLTTIGQGPGKPVNVASGKLWYRTADLRLSGPFGVNFTRWYDNQSPYNEARRQGARPGIGWRWAHCWASCTMTKTCGTSQRGGKVIGFGKEVGDFIGCSAQVMVGLPGTSGQCESAFQSSDFDDNDRGRSCPPGMSCEERCRTLKGQTAEPGPFFGMGIPGPGFGGPVFPAPGNP